MSSAEHEPSLPEPSVESPPVRLAARLASLVWWFLLFVLLVFALYAGVGRQLTRNVDAFADQLAGELSARTGQKVAIGSLSSRWFWLDPSFTARNITVTNPESGVTSATVDLLRVRFDFLSSLLRFRVVFEDFEVDGVQLALNQSSSGDLGVRGADLPEPVNHRLQHWLGLAGEWLSEPYLKITRLSLSIRDNQGHVRHVDVPQLDLVYRQGLFRASGRAMRSGTTEQLASFSLVGQHFFRGDFTGQLYLNINSGRLFDGLVDSYQWRTMRVEGFDLGGEAWLTLKDGELMQVTGSVTTPYVQLGVGRESLAPIENIRARFGWRRADTPEGDDRGDLMAAGEWHLKALEWRWNDDQVSPFSLRLVPDDRGMTVIADALPLGPTRRLLSLLPLLPEPAAQALSHYRPDGYLDQVSLRLPNGPEESFELTGRLRDISIGAYQGAPSVSGLSASLYLDRRSGRVQIDDTASSVALDFPRLFNDGWRFTEFNGSVSWLLDGSTTRVFSEDLSMRYGDSARFAGAFDLNLDSEGEDSLSVRVDVQDATEQLLGEFVPAKVVDPTLYDWLTTSIKKANITSGFYRGQGRIDPDAPEGAFGSSMRFDFEQATVAYDDRWPEVTGAQGWVEVVDQDARVTLERGETGGLTLSPSTVTVAPDNGAPLIRVDAVADVPGDAIEFWMRNSPVGDFAGTQAAELKYGGQFQLKLGIALPLVADRDVVVEARVSAEEASVTDPEAGIAWQGIQGDLTYHSVDGFSEGPLTARFLNHPVSISFSRTDAGNGLSIRQSGQLPVSDLLASAGLSPERSLGLSGTLTYSAGLEVSESRSTAVWLKSDLQGMAIDWPEPLAKTAEQVAPLRAEIDPRAAGGVAIRGDWENRTSFDLLWKKTGLELAVSHLYLGRQNLKDIQVEALDLGDRWVATTKSERAVGRLVIPDDGGTVIADFETLRLLRDEGAKREDTELLTIEEQLEAFRSLDMGQWPDVDVTIADLQLDRESLGNWSFQFRPEPYRLKVESIEARLNSLALLGSLTWSIIDDREVTRFAGEITGGALADFNSLLGSDIPLTNERTNIQLDLGWPGRPDEISLPDMSGSVSLRLDEGIILEQNNTAQLFRVFNLLNADTLWRRLKLDFSDLYERGVAFDAISGKAQLVDGLVTMDPELQIVGPSGAFKLSGSTDIADETLDMRLVVVLPLTQNLPLAALLMGAGAPIGGALFVLDKILGDPLSKLTSATYGVTGTWDDPKVDLRRVFDTGE